MKFYDEIPESERHALTSEEIAELCLAELARQGYAPLKKLKLEHEPEVEIETRSYFQVSCRDARYGGREDLDVLLNSSEQAHEFVELLKRSQARFKGYAGYSGASYVADPISDMQVKQMELPSREDAANQSEASKDLEEIRSRNRKAQEEHKEALNAHQQLTEWIYEDWHKHQREESARQDIRDTWAQFLNLADGNEDIARNFMLKRHTIEQCKTAIEGFDAQVAVAAEDSEA